MKKRTINKDESGIRIDRWFKRHYPDVPTVLVQKLLRKGAIKVNGEKQASGGYRVAVGDQIHIPDSMQGDAIKSGKKSSLPTPSKEDTQAVLNAIIFEDDQLIVLNKPSGLAVQGGSKIKQSVDSVLRYHYGKRGILTKLVHRLDKETSGVLLVAKTAPMAEQLAEAFREKTVRKYYIAVVDGVIKPRQGRIEKSIEKQLTAHKQEQVVVSDNGKPATTEYSLLHSTRKHSLVLLQPVTGRMHQLRVHMQSIGHPILGDRKYGLDKDNTSRLMLHAYAIELPDRMYGVDSRFRADVAKNMLDIMQSHHLRFDENKLPQFFA